MWKVRLDRGVEKALRRLMPEARQRILKALKQLQDNPLPPGAEKLKTTNEWRMRIGTYRIIYRLDEKNRIIEVSEIGHRRDI